MTTDQLIELLAPGTSRQYWESLLPPWLPAPKHQTPSRIPQQQRQGEGSSTPQAGPGEGSPGHMCHDMQQQLGPQAADCPAGLCSTPQAPGQQTAGDTAAVCGSGGEVTAGEHGAMGDAAMQGSGDDMSESDGGDMSDSGDQGGWPVMPPPGFVMADVVIGGGGGEVGAMEG